MKQIDAIEKVVRSNIELFTLGEDINDWDFNPNKLDDLAFIGGKIFNTMTDEFEKEVILSGMSGTEMNPETKHSEYAVAMTVAIGMADDINQCVYDTLNDEATRKGL